MVYDQSKINFRQTEHTYIVMSNA